MQFDFATTPRVIVRPGALRAPADWVAVLPGRACSW